MLERKHNKLWTMFFIKSISLDFKKKIKNYHWWLSRISSKVLTDGEWGKNNEDKKKLQKICSSLAIKKNSK